jgi:neutral ceramidase
MVTLLAGTAKTVITPPIGYRMGQWGLRQGRSTGVYRDLFARSLVLDDGATKLAIVSMEVCGVPKDTMQDIQRKVSGLTGIPAESLLVNSTHNHTAPDILLGVTPAWRTYAAYLADLVAGSVYEAMHAMRPAEAGHGSGKLEGWTINRQYRDRPVDNEVGVLRIDEPDGTPIARVVNFAAHGVCDGGQYLDWSGDFSGELSATIEDIDAGAVAIHLQGAAGDVHPFDWWFGNLESKHLHTHEDTAKFGEAIAREALRVSVSIEPTATVALNSAAAEMALPRRQVPWSVEEAEKLHRKLTAGLGEYTGDVWPDGTTTANAAERHAEMYGNGRNELSLATNQSLPPVPLMVQAFRIGELVISAHAGEMFNELGLAIKEGAGGERPWVASYSSEYIGYVSTRRPYAELTGVPVADLVDMKRFRRFYGTTTSPFAPDAGEMLVDRAIELLESV